MVNLNKGNQANISEKASDDFVEALKKVAHSLSQPLTSLRGSVEVALMGEMNESECRQVLELALQESQRMAASLETLRDLLETEGSVEEVQPVSWTRSVEKSLEKAAVLHNSPDLQLLSSMGDEVWVRGIPQCVDTATRRLVKAVIESCHGKHVVRVGLSVRGETACLSVCAESLVPDTETLAQKKRTDSPPAASGLGDPDWWIVRRAVERQGGMLKIDEISETHRCYRLNLPLAASKMGRHS